jgi:hypothetical protein
MRCYLDYARNLKADEENLIVRHLETPKILR